jgi:hypothetical protein
MVKTANDVMDITPLERMDKLEDIETEKRGTIASKKKEFEELEKNTKKGLEELDQKKRKEFEELDKRKQKDLDELDKKRKELKDLEDKKLKEIEETEALIEKSFQELMRHKRILLKEEDDKDQDRRKTSAAEINLEEVANTAPKIVPEGVHMNYSKFFENLQAPQKFYEINNPSFYEGLTGLRNKAATGQITPEEEMFVEKLRNQFEQFTQNQQYTENDQNQYIKRSMSVIDQIGKYHKMRSD